MMKEWITRNSTSVQHQHAYTTARWILVVKDEADLKCAARPSCQ